MKKILLAIVMASGLMVSGCDSDSKADFSEYERDNLTQTRDLYYSYPSAGQENVAPNTPIVLAFMASPNAKASEFALEFEDAEGNLQSLNFDEDALKVVNDSRGVVLTPSQALNTNTTYTLKFNSSAVSYPSEGISFTTRPANKGPIADQITSDQLVVESFIPDGKAWPFTDISSLNLRFSQPLDVQTVTPETVKITQGGKALEATLLAKGRMLTIDPTMDFTPDQPVTVTLDGLKSELGEVLATYTETLTPQSTAPRATQVLEVLEAKGCKDNPSAESPLTGLVYNCIPVLAKLIGDDAENPAIVSEQSGDLQAELAYLPNYLNKTPLRISKGSLLKGSALNIMIGGEIPAGFDSGPVVATFVSDANGYLLDNPYTKDPNAPKQLVLSADIAFDTAGSEAEGTKQTQANGAFTQNLMHLTLVGTAKVDVETGRLVADAVAVLELNVLGVEEGYGVLSFHMESYRDQTIERDQMEDGRPLELSAWVPGEMVDAMRPGDPIILQFNKPLAPNSVRSAVDKGTLAVQRNGVDEAFEWRLNGTSLVIQTKEDLQFSAPDEASKYSVSYGGDLTDTTGANAAAEGGLEFVMPVYQGLQEDTFMPEVGTPFVLTTYPGFPCVTDPTTRDLTGDEDGFPNQGHCLDTKGSKNNWTDSQGELTDKLPIPLLPANRDIRITFSQSLAPESVNDKTVFVEQCENEECLSSGRFPVSIQVKGNVVILTPKQPWVEGQLYRYTLLSAPKATSVCGENAICSIQKIPMHNALSNSELDVDGGGAKRQPLEVYFKAATKSDSVFQALRNHPTLDVDASFNHYEIDMSLSDQLRNSIKLEATGVGKPLIPIMSFDHPTTGCEFAEGECPEKQFLFVSGGLNVEIMGYQTAEDIAAMLEAGELQASSIPSVLLGSNNEVTKGAVLVNVLPAQLLTSTNSVHVEVTTGPSTRSVDMNTGPQVMRIRYAEDKHGHRTQPVVGWIVEGEGGPQFITTLDVYLDAPYIRERTNAGYQKLLQNNAMNDIALSGAVRFLPDGRLMIEQVSQKAIELTVNALGMADIHLQIPEKGIFLNYIGEPIEN